ncbi:hypothetical protein [Erwinia phage Snitter]|nr:hypothetical protein [Erwinia phage Snitter]
MKIKDKSFKAICHRTEEGLPFTEGKIYSCLKVGNSIKLHDDKSTRKCFGSTTTQKFGESFGVGFEHAQCAHFKPIIKTPLQRMNRAFRKATESWIGKKPGFKTRKQHRSWCRRHAKWLVDCLEDAEFLSYDSTGNAKYPVMMCQDDFDEIVETEMSYWD